MTSGPMTGGPTGMAMVKLIDNKTCEELGMIQTDWLPRVNEYVLDDSGSAWIVVKVLHAPEMTELYVRPYKRAIGNRTPVKEEE